MSAKPSRSKAEVPDPGACRYVVRLSQTGETYDCADSETLLQGMLRIGRKGIPVGCVNGGCGICKISVPKGTVRKVGAMSRAHVSAEEEARGVCLACRVAPLQSLEVEVVGKMKKALAYHWGGSASSFSDSAGETDQPKET